MVKLLVMLLSTILCFSASTRPVLSGGKISADRKYLKNIMAPYRVKHEKRLQPKEVSDMIWPESICYTCFLS